MSDHESFERICGNCMGIDVGDISEADIDNMAGIWKRRGDPVTTEEVEAAKRCLAEMKLEAETTTIYVVWEENARTGRGELHLICDEYADEFGGVIPFDDPITDGSDSHSIAALVSDFTGADVLAVDHDRDYIHLRVKAPCTIGG